jgi:hypothetical protein
MFETFTSFLGTRCSVLAAAPGVNADRLSALREEINKIASSTERNWDAAYSIERELILLRTGEGLHQHLLSLLNEAQERGIKATPRLRGVYEGISSKLYDKATPPALVEGAEQLLRNLASSVIEEMQWEAKKKYVAIPLRRKATHRIILAGLVSFALFMIPYIGSLVGLWRQADTSLLPIWTALSSGLLGAFFSRLLDIQRNIDILTLEEVEAARAWRSVILRGAVGMLGALIVFFLLRSGLVEGKLVPKFDNLALDLGKVVLPSGDLALLVVWCFIAGFSERIVPDMLSATGTRLAGNTREPSGAKQS